MSNTTLLVILILAGSIILPILFIGGRRWERFCADVKEYLQKHHPEIVIIKQVGFGFDLQIGDRVHRVWMHPLYMQYRKNPSAFESLVESWLITLPLEGRSISSARYYRRHE
jgi:hypothetical protein